MPEPTRARHSPGPRAARAQTDARTGVTIARVALPMKFSAADASPRGPAPAFGEHAEAILRDLDYAPDQIASLAKSHAVRC